MKRIREAFGVIGVILAVCAACALAAFLKLSAAQHVVDIGPFPDSNIGDTEWTAFQKVNSNFTELYAALGPGLTFSNLGQTGGHGIYRARIGGTNVQLNMLQQGSNVIIYSNANGIFLNALAPSTIGGATNSYSVTVESFGAVGNGVTDDTAAISNAVNAVSAAGGGTVLFGPKSYRTYSTLFFSNLKPVILYGVDPERSKIILGVSGSTDAGIHFTSTANPDGVAFINLGLGGLNNSDVSPWDNILIGDGWSNVRFENCYIYNARHAGVRWSYTTGGRYALFERCRFFQINSPAMTAQAGGMILGSPLSDIHVRNCRFELLGTNRSTMQAVYLVGLGNTLTNWSIEDCTFVGTNARPHAYGGTSYGGVFKGNRMTDVQGVTMDAVVGLTYSANTHSNSTTKLSSDSAVVSGNGYINGTIQVLGGVNVLIDGNGMTNTATTGIVIDGANPVTVKNNRIVAGGTAVGIAINVGNGHKLYNNEVSTLAESPLLVTGTSANNYSMGNHWKITAAANSRILQNSGSGTGNVSENDILESSDVAPVLNFTLIGSHRRGFYSNYFGKAVLVGGTVTVPNNTVTANANIQLTRQVTGGTVGHLTIGTIVAGTSFVINSSEGADTSTVGYEIVDY